jgi:hypothetical protein
VQLKNRVLNASTFEQRNEAAPARLPEEQLANEQDSIRTSYAKLTLNAPATDSEWQPRKTVACKMTE